MSAAASDVITYIGVPLAVLGVLPILYTFVLAILNQRRIRHALILHGHKPASSRKGRARDGGGFTIRSSPMTTLIEVELPRYTIAPLDRNDERYWRLAPANTDVEDTRDMSDTEMMLDRAPSTLSMVEEGKVQGFLRGGSWRAFHWNKLIVGKKLYRIQYEDELREPPSEIDFTDLMHFLLDWGAVMDGMGWEKLRHSGLWTPAGTVLMYMPEYNMGNVVSRDGSDDEGVDGKKGWKPEVRTRTTMKRGEWVLRTSMPDESDGILTLCIRWPGRSDDVEFTRGAKSLPPGWGRLIRPSPIVKKEKAKHDKINLVQRIEQQQILLSSEDVITSTSMRFKIDNNSNISGNNSNNSSEGKITQVYWELNNHETGSSSTLNHLANHPLGQQWFTSATTAILHHKTSQSSSSPSSNNTGTLWGFTPSQPITTLIRKDTLPAGVLVLLDLLPDSEAPEWEPKQNKSTQSINMALKFQERTMARRNAELLESTMSPDQARVHRQNREMAERRKESDEIMAQMRERREREEKRVQDAISGPRMDCQVGVKWCLTYLKDQGEVGMDWSVWDVVEALLYLFVVEDDCVSRCGLAATTNNNGGEEYNDKKHNYEATNPKETVNVDNNDTKPNTTIKSKQIPNEPSQTSTILHILDEWSNWSVAGGMKRDQFELLQESKVEFCFAVCIVSVVQLHSNGTGVAGFGVGGGGGSGNGSGSGMGSVGRASVDMLECLNMWRRVRLG